MTIALKFWREIAIGLLLIAVVVSWNVIQQRNDAIHQLDIQIAEINTRTATDNKWVAATTEVLTQMVDAQNKGIDRVLAGINQSTANITGTVNVVRVENAKKVAGLQTFIATLPTATDCTVMMDNMIRNGEAVQW